MHINIDESNGMPNMRDASYSESKMYVVEDIDTLTKRSIPERELELFGLVLQNHLELI
jgi:hypothetical protein